MDKGIDIYKGILIFTILRIKILSIIYKEYNLLPLYRVHTNCLQTTYWSQEKSGEAGQHSHNNYLKVFSDWN